MHFKRDLSFRNIAIDYLIDCEFRGAAPATLKKMESLLRVLLPVLGPWDISELTAKRLLVALKWKVKRGRHDTVRDAIKLTNQIIKYAIETDRFEGDNECDFLLYHLPKRKRKGVRPARSSQALGNLISSIKTYHGDLLVRAGLMALAHTLVMPMRVRFARWEDLDLEARLWRLPTHGKSPERLVRLSEQAASIFVDTARFRTPRSEWIFSSLRQPNYPVSDMTYTSALRALAHDEKPFSGSSFRKSARHHLKRFGYTPAAINRRLSGLNPDVLESSNEYEQALEMSQTWSDFLEALPAQPHQPPSHV
ncbi:site-specific recombinase, phage integrase family protein [Oceanicaulis sp. HTCC2633]|uniref:tyrosine-type recombinase/integrase n=1 Tax=Oceanicaulis sp. HTCC2633 TaxID=314254 RepID=UPI000066D569|nr:tyrosine-type recombinase/integrase [Oceanicaulis sp. HTCC2633]EAP91263.1 site-specific recombinase, phage integrase family protein [Oceanicaulis sp. HTCC2633]